MRCPCRNVHALLVLTATNRVVLPSAAAFVHIPTRSRRIVPVASDIRIRKDGTLSQPSCLFLATNQQMTASEVEGLTVPQLKEQLKARGLKVSGRKSELIERLLESHVSDNVANEPDYTEDESDIETKIPTGNDQTATKDGDIAWGGEDISTFEEYKEQLVAFAFLSSIGDTDAAGKAQDAFDSMYENFITEDDDSLEPTTEIYNLLMEAYADSDPQASPKGAEKAEEILDRLESALGSSGDSSDADEVATASLPSPDINSYIAVMRGYASRAQPMSADAIFRRLYNHFMTRGDTAFMPTTAAYNELIRGWQKSGTKSASRVTKDLLNEMIDANDDNVLPNTETYARVMACYARNQNEDAPQEVERLMDRMAQENLKPDTAVYNVQIKAFGCKGVPDGGSRASDALHWMIKEYRNGKDGMKPNPASFINAINAMTVNGGKRSPQKAEEFIGLMVKLSNEFDDEELMPSVRVYNAVIRCWARSRERNKAREARRILDTMLKKSSDESGFHEAMKPNVQSFNAVLNACSFPSRGSTSEDKFSSFQIAVTTLNELRAAEDCEPNHVSYGSFLRACGNLMPQSAKRDSVVGNIFRKCCEEGKVSQFVLDSFLDASTEGLKNTFFGNDRSREKSLPLDWSRNV